jgi:hypothetical protein
MILAWAISAGTGVTVLGIIGAVLALILLAGLVAGQFRRGVVSELREALASAQVEIDLANGRADRLEASLKFMEQRIHELEARPDWSQVVALMHSLESNIIAAIKTQAADTSTTAAAIAAALAKPS